MLEFGIVRYWPRAYRKGTSVKRAPMPITIDKQGDDWARTEQHCD